MANDFPPKKKAKITVRDDKTKVFWLTSLYVGDVSGAFSDDVRRAFIINLFSSVGVIFTLPLGVVALFEEEHVLGFCLLMVALLYTANHVYLRRTHNHAVSGNFVIYPLYILMIFLIYSGGVKGTGHVWIYCVPAVALFLQGLKRGLIELALFTLALIVVLYFTNNHFADFGYDPALKSRILFSLMVVIFLSAIYEYCMSRFNEELKATSIELECLAYMDTLTALLNRRGMMQRLEKSAYQSFHLLLADVDFFKRINDEYGHDAGDYALKELAQMIQRSLPEKGLAARWGGEEFLMAVCDCTKSDAFALAELIRQEIEDHEFVYLDHKFRMTLSVGVATMNESTPLHDAITLADDRLYSAKRAGRNQVRAK